MAAWSNSLKTAPLSRLVEAAQGRVQTVGSNEKVRTGLLVLFSAITVWLAYRVVLVCHGYASDDAYITYRYAYNFAVHNSLVYNLGECYQGSTSMFYALLLGCLGKVFGANNMPAIAEACSFVGLSATGIGLIAFFATRNKAVIGFMAAAFYILSMSVINAMGFETLLQLPFIVWAYTLYVREVVDRKRNGLAPAALIGVATLMRPDGAVWALPIMVHASWLRWCRTPGPTGPKLKATLKPLAIEVGLYMAVLAPFALAAYLYYGNILPGTLAAKMAQTPTGWFPPFVRGAEQWYVDARFLNEPRERTLFVLAATGLVFLRDNRLAMLLGAGALAYFTVYATLNVPSYTWYFTPIDLILGVLAASGIYGLVGLVSRKPILVAAAGLILAWLGIGFVRDRITSGEAYHGDMISDPKWSAYRGLGSFLSQSLPPGSSLGYCEVGHIGWASRDKVNIVDQLMLVTPGNYAAISRRVLDSAFKEHLPTVIAESPVLLGTNRGHTWFRQNYEYWTAFPVPRSTPLTLAEAERFQKNRVCEMDLWRKRPVPLSLDNARKLAAIDNANRHEFAKS